MSFDIQNYGNHHYNQDDRSINHLQKFCYVAFIGSFHFAVKSFSLLKWGYEKSPPNLVQALDLSITVTLNLSNVSKMWLILLVLYKIE